MIFQLGQRLLQDGFRVTSDDLMDPEKCGSYFARFFRTMMQRLPSLTECVSSSVPSSIGPSEGTPHLLTVPPTSRHCMICDSRLSGPGILPSVCRNELCHYQFVDLRLCGLALAAVSTEQSVLDLLFMMLQHACFSSQPDLLFEPYPLIRSGTISYRIPMGLLFDGISH